MRLRAVGGLTLMVVGVLFAVAGLFGAIEEPDPAGTVVGVLVLSLPVVGLGAWLWRGRNGGTPSGRRHAKMAAAGLVGVLLLGTAAFAFVDGASAAGASMVLFAALAFGYVGVTRNTAEDDVVATMLDLPTGPEPGLLVVVPRAKRLVHVIGVGVAGVCLAVMAPSLRAEGEGAWWFLAATAVVLLVAFPWMAVRMRGRAGLGVSRSGVSFTQAHRTVLVPWEHLEGVEAYRMRTGRGGHIRMVGLYVDDVEHLVGLSKGLRRLARVNRRLGPHLAWPATQFDLEDDQIVDLVRRYHQAPERRRELDRSTPATVTPGR